VATYDLDNADVLKGEAYQAVGIDNLSVWSKRVMARIKLLMRFEGELILRRDREAPKASGIITSIFRLSPRYPARYALSAFAEPVTRRSAMSRFTASPHRTCPIRQHGRQRPIHRGPNVCGHISATPCGS
jgi:hypothetical protein